MSGRVTTPRVVWSLLPDDLALKVSLFPGSAQASLLIARLAIEFDFFVNACLRLCQNDQWYVGTGSTSVAFPDPHGRTTRPVHSVAQSARFGSGNRVPGRDPHLIGQVRIRTLSRLELRGVISVQVRFDALEQNGIGSYDDG